MARKAICSFLHDVRCRATRCLRPMGLLDDGRWHSNLLRHRALHFPDLESLHVAVRRSCGTDVAVQGELSLSSLSERPSHHTVFGCGPVRICHLSRMDVA